MFYQDLFNWLFAWGRSRRWQRMFWLGILPLGLLLCVFCLVAYGGLLSRQTIASRYLELVNDDLESSLKRLAAAGPPSAAAEGPTTDQEDRELTETAAQRVQVPLRRILQLGNSNERVVYIVACEMSRQGRMGMAARMMRQIAPADGRGFAQAYAWLADYQTQPRNWTSDEARALLSDLEFAAHGGANLSLAQIRNYAALLVQFQRPEDALKLLRNHAEQFPELNLQMAALAKQSGTQNSQFRDAMEAGRDSFLAKQRSGEATEQDWIQAVQLEMVDNDIDQALLIAKRGFELNSTAVVMRQLYSDVLLAKHQSLGGFVPGDDTPPKPKGVPDLRYLEAACQVYSANPALGPEIAKAVAMGQNLSLELKGALEISLVDGTASGITHLILANSKLVGQQPSSALPHLRLSLRQMPDSPVVMNNLAYVILKYEPEHLDEAAELMKKALSIPGGSRNDRAAMFDTYAEILLSQHDIVGAIEMFEQAIELDGEKLNTRRKLAQAYLQAEMPDLAQAQQQRIEELEAKK